MSDVGRGVLDISSLLFLVSFTVYTVSSAQASGEAVLVSSFIRIENEQFSANNITTGDIIEVKAEISSLINRNLTLTMAPLIAESQKEPYDPAVVQLFLDPSTLLNGGLQTQHCQAS
jgi:hypothetical protein